MNKLKIYWRFARPFTLLPPAIGMISGALTAYGAAPFGQSSWYTTTQEMVFAGAIGTTLAATLNTASNALNQIYDLKIDKINKPKRPLCTGEISHREAWVFTWVFYFISLALAYCLNPYCFWIVVTAALMTFMYSAPPFRTKRHWLTANITIAIPRGILLKVCGWASIKQIDAVEPWYIGGIFGFFLLGAATTKDYADIEGDRAEGCITLPIRFGVKKSAWMITPFFILPFLMLPLGVHFKILTGNPLLATLLGWFLAIWGTYVAWLIIRKPEELATTENHISWTHMYLMMMALQVGLAVVYL
ncbi:MAG: UbiA family prenyltransferase, partial [Planctomycetota bacterium]